MWTDSMISCVQGISRGHRPQAPLSHNHLCQNAPCDQNLHRFLWRMAVYLSLIPVMVPGGAGVYTSVTGSMADRRRETDGLTDWFRVHFKQSAHWVTFWTLIRKKWPMFIIQRINKRRRCRSNVGSRGWWITLSNPHVKKKTKNDLDSTRKVLLPLCCCSCTHKKDLKWSD